MAKNSIKGLHILCRNNVDTNRNLNISTCQSSVELRQTSGRHRTSSSVNAREWGKKSICKSRGPGSGFSLLLCVCVCEEDWLWANIYCQSSSFCLRKMGPELTSMPIFLYFIHGMPTTAWLAKRCHVCTWDPNRWTLGLWSRTCALNRCTTGPAPPT